MLLAFNFLEISLDEWFRGFRCADPVRFYSALYVGGMGSKDRNFYHQLACRLGYEEAADRIQESYLARDYDAAMAAVPFEFMDSTSLLGPHDRVRDRLAAYADAGVTTLTLGLYAGSLDERVATLREMADILDESGLAE